MEAECWQRKAGIVTGQSSKQSDVAIMFKISFASKLANVQIKKELWGGN
jgi:hypothetical protein